MNFSIVTPSYRNSEWLKLCIASVADQKGVEFEHIVQDSCSDDGTQDWLPSDPRVTAYIEKDGGMYDAINRGFNRASGDILAYLNCDEQYLPGALKAVHDFFETHPDVDVVFSDTVIADAAGDYLCHRYALLPLKNHIWVRFPVLTCSLFIRRRVVYAMGILFDTRWRALGDLFWVAEMLARNVKMAVLRAFTSTFTETGTNLALTAGGKMESAAKCDLMPRWVRAFSPAIIFFHRLRLLLSGVYFQKPFDYALYTLSSPERRVTRHVQKPTALWRERL